MADRTGRPHDEDSSVSVAEEPTARELHQRYAIESAQQQADNERLVQLRDKALEQGLTSDEQMERFVLQQACEDREHRLTRLEREAVVAQDELNIQEVLSVWDGLVAQKEAAYAQVERAITDLYSAWQGVFHVHHEQELEWAKLPRDGSNLSTFPGGGELAQNITGRMGAGWNGILNDHHQHVWQIDWPMVHDVDPGLKPLSATSIGRIRERAQAYRLKVSQQIANAQDEGQADE